jgi:hypothetical protein
MVRRPGYIWMKGKTRKNGLYTVPAFNFAVTHLAIISFILDVAWLDVTGLLLTGIDRPTGLYSIP